mgnify:CR=1 FL=1
MTSRLPCLATTLAAIAGLSAAESGSPFALGSRQLGGAGNQLLGYVHGLLDLDLFGHENRTDGNNDRSDGGSTTHFRSELGMHIVLDERIEAKLTLAYQAQAGDYDNSVADHNVVMDDAYVVLKEFFGQPGLSLRAGRMPVSWNLRTDKGSFLHDSRADYPAVTSWDGARFQWGIETLVFTPFAYALPDQSDLYGVIVDWQPEQAAENGLFLSGQFTMTNDPVTYATNPAGTTGDQLMTWLGGAELRVGSWDFFLEGGLQSGDADPNREYGGYAIYAGAEWHPRTPTPQIYTFQIDSLRGDDDTSDGKIRHWVNPYEGQQDTLIVENEKYGELARSTDAQGLGRQAAKLSGDWGLDSNGIFRLKAVYAYYLLGTDRLGDDDFGQEVDLTFTWQYNRAGNAFLSLFAAGFFPGDGFALSAPSTPADTDPIWLGGANLEMSF